MYFVLLYVCETSSKTGHYYFSATLADEEENLLKWIWSMTEDQTVVLAENFGLRLTRESFMRLRDNEWLDDMV